MVAARRRLRHQQPRRYLKPAPPHAGQLAPRDHCRRGGVADLDSADLTRHVAASRTRRSPRDAQAARVPVTWSGGRSRPAVLFLNTLTSVNRVATGLATATLLLVVVRTRLSVRHLHAQSNVRQRQSITNPLTGLANRPRLFEALDGYFAQPPDDRPSGVPVHRPQRPQAGSTIPSATRPATRFSAVSAPDSNSYCARLICWPVWAETNLPPSWWGPELTRQLGGRPTQRQARRAVSNRRDQCIDRGEHRHRARLHDRRRQPRADELR